MIYDSLAFLENKGCDSIVSYNIYEYSNAYDFIFDVAKKYHINHVVLKVTNTVMGDEEIIDTNSLEYGDYIYKIIEKYHHDFMITFGCGLSRSIFTPEQRKYIEQHTSIELKYGCENNGGRYDINTDGSIYRCYPLQSIYDKHQIFVTDTLFQRNTIA
jgi:hypothetical protein